MDMHEWARREVDIACGREHDACNTTEGDWNYGCACYESALKAFNSLMEDGHSGMSISIIKHILNRLIDGKCLTPIEDTEDIWEEYPYRRDGELKHYQCKRMSSLFKDVMTDGTIKYTDVDRVHCENVNSPGVSFACGLARDIINEMFPITMPYMPENKGYKIVMEEWLVDPKNGDYDTQGVLWVVKPDGEKVYINRYFAEVDGEFKEIDYIEYAKRTVAAKESIDIYEV